MTANEIILYKGKHLGKIYEILYDDEEGFGRIGFYEYENEEMYDMNGYTHITTPKEFERIMKGMARGMGILSFIPKWTTDDEI